MIVRTIQTLGLTLRPVLSGVRVCACRGGGMLPEDNRETDRKSSPPADSARVHCLRSAERWRKQLRVPRRRKSTAGLSLTPVAIHLSINDNNAESTSARFFPSRFRGTGASPTLLSWSHHRALIPWLWSSVARTWGSDKHRPN